jgi:hypothetical protein
MGLNMKEKQAVTREYKTPYQKVTKKEKAAVLDQFTRLTGYHRKSAVRILRVKPGWYQILSFRRRDSQCL